MPGFDLPFELPQLPAFNPTDVEMMVRMLLAFALGALLGWERERAGRPAGLRTFMMVTAGSAAFTLVSIYGFICLQWLRSPGRRAEMRGEPSITGRAAEE